MYCQRCRNDSVIVDKVAIRNFLNKDRVIADTRHTGREIHISTVICERCGIELGKIMEIESAKSWCRSVYRNICEKGKYVSEFKRGRKVKEYCLEE